MTNQPEITNAPRIIVAIDGYSSSGKSTMARELAKRIDYIYIDSGAMYRAVAYYALTHGFIENNVIDLEAVINMLPEISISFAQIAGEDGIQHTILNNVDVEKR